MMYLDTHALIWLYSGETERFPTRARALLEAHELVISPMVLLEMQFLRETKRLLEDPRILFERLAREIALQCREVPMLAVAQEACLQGWTRDPFDRMIVAQCEVDQATLLTKDRLILRHFPRARWDKS